VGHRLLGWAHAASLEQMALARFVVVGLAGLVVIEAAGLVENLAVQLDGLAQQGLGVGEVATLCGRYWAMDRDNRWERVRTAYDCLTGRRPADGAESPNFADLTTAIQDYYDNPLSQSQRGDEFITPRTVGADPAATRIRSGRGPASNRASPPTRISTMRASIWRVCWSKQENSSARWKPQGRCSMGTRRTPGIGCSTPGR